MGHVVLVTGVSREVGGRYAQALTREPGIDRVIGVDVVPPPSAIDDVEFVRADIRNPVIASVIHRADVDTVVHLNVVATPRSAGGRVAMKEINIIGTMQLLAACQNSPRLKRLVVKSSGAVYGSSPSDPALFTEDMAARSAPTSGFGKDSVEVEGYVRGFSRRRGDVEICMLRFASIIGPRVRTSMTDYFSLPVIPTPLGFDARLQFVHEDDAVAALIRAATARVSGVINIAGDGVLSVHQAARMAGRLSLPVPLQAGGWVGQAIRRWQLADFSPDQVRYLAFGRGLDTTRMRQTLGFEPTFSTRAAFAEFVAAGRGGTPVLLPALIDAVEAGRRSAVREPESRQPARGRP